MRRFLFFLLGIFIIFVYILSSNIISELRNISFTEEHTEKTSSGLLELNVGTNLGVTVTRHRWYGKIIENVGDISYLYLFNFIRIPIKVKDSGWVKYHSIFLVLFSLYLFFFCIKTRRNKNEELG